MKVLQLDSNEEYIEEIVDLYKEIWKTDDDSIKKRFLRHSTYEGY